MPWRGRVWLNPPYGKVIGKFLDKASESAGNGDAELVVALLPSHMDASWMHDYVLDRADIIVFRGRVPFIDPTGKGRTQP